MSSVLLQKWPHDFDQAVTENHVLVGVPMDTIEGTGNHDLGNVEEVAALQMSNGPVMHMELSGLFLCSREQISKRRDLPNVRWRQQQNGRCLTIRTSTALLNNVDHSQGQGGDSGSSGLAYRPVYDRSDSRCQPDANDDGRER